MSTPKKNTDLLGKGIRSLLQNIDTDLKNTEGGLKPQIVEEVTGSKRLILADIEINPKQPRRDFDEAALNELAASIKLHDIIQPLTVSKLANGKYQLIAGERRFRASKIAGLKDVPVYIRQANDQQLLELALLENLQREKIDQESLRQETVWRHYHGMYLWTIFCNVQFCAHLRHPGGPIYDDARAQGQMRGIGLSPRLLLCAHVPCLHVLPLDPAGIQA